MNSKGSFAKMVLIFTFVFIIGYTVFSLYLTYSTGIPEPSTLTTCVFGYFSIETVLLMIKKLKGGSLNESTDYDDTNDNQYSSFTYQSDSGVDQGVTDIQTSTNQHSRINNISSTREPWYIRVFRS